MRRIENRPPPGSSDRFWLTMPSVSVSSPRVVTAAREPHAAQVEVPRAVLAEQPPLEAGLADRVAAPVEEHRVGRLADRLQVQAVAQRDVAGELDPGRQRVRPRRAQLRLGPHRASRGSGSERREDEEPPGERDAAHLPFLRVLPRGRKIARQSRAWISRSS
jgi:hypothetical protein